MKPLTSVAVILFFITSGPAATSIIQGTIEGCPEDSEYAFLQAVIHYFHRVANPKEEIRPDGTFKLLFDLPRRQDVLLHRLRSAQSGTAGTAG
jgi:hypothetical protein